MNTDISGINEADVALPVCLPGLQGLPIQISGWSTLTQREPLIIPNDIHCQFSQTGNIQSNTFFMNGTQYFVASIDITQPKQEGLLDTSTKPFGEIHIWGKPTATTLEKSSIALLSIPLANASEANEAGKKLEHGPNISNFLPTGNDIQIVKYTTCVEVEKGTLTAHVAYWTTPIVISLEFYKNQFPNELRKFAVPVSLLDGTKILTSFEQYNDANKTKTKRVYRMSEDNNFSIPYSSSVLLKTTSPEFQHGIRLIKGFSMETKHADLNTSSYKCIAINRMKDIKNGQLTVDPRTGKTLAQENEDAEKELNQSLKTNPNPTNNPYKIILITIGIIVGLCGIALIVYLIQYLISTRKVAGLPPSLPLPAVVNPIVTIPIAPPTATVIPTVPKNP